MPGVLSRVCSTVPRLHHRLRTPVLARSYSSKAAASKEKIDLGTFDYVIVGGGSAGCVLANRLSADPSISVAVLEAGANDKYPWLHVPVGYLYAIGNAQRRTNWGYVTTPQPGLNGRSIGQPRGKVLGGCGAINGMVTQRGQPQDYDSWASLLGDDSWGWDTLLPMFEEHVDYRAGDPIGPDGRAIGSGGPLPVSRQRVSWRILDQWADACEAAGIPRRTHFIDSRKDGVGYFEVAQLNGVRKSAYRAFLRPIENRKNLTILTHAHASRLIFEKEADGRISTKGLDLWRRARRDTLSENCRAMLVDMGLIKTHGDHGALSTDVPCTIRARREVILAAGAIGSPHLLQCSGVGDDALLREHSLETVADLPGVGANLHDHLQVRMAFKLHKSAVSLNAMSNSLLGRARMGLQYAFNQSGPMSMSPSQVGLFATSSPDVGSPDLQWHIQPLSLDAWGEPLHPWPGLTASVTHLRPTSRGTLKMASSDTRDPPLIDPAYLSTEGDRKAVVAGMRLTRDIASRLDSTLEAVEFAPGKDIQCDEDLIRAAGNIATSIFHPTGTTRMGPDNDPGAVVDNKLRVRDGRGGIISGLRVADCGCMPSVTSGNTYFPTMVIGEKASRMILADH